MARIFIDGFENGSGDLWTSAAGNFTATACNGSYGWYGYNYQVISKNVGERSVVFIGFNFQNLGPYNKPCFRIRLGTTALMTVNYDPSEFWELYRGGATLLGQTDVGSCPFSTWFHVQIKYVPDPSSGILQVKFNDVLVFDYSGNTVPGSETTLDNVYFRADHSQSAERVDDVVIDDSDWPGVTKIAAIKPTGAGATTSWTPSAGSNWDCVDEVPPSDTDYVYINSADQIDTYAAGDLPAEADTIKCVQVQARALKQSDATPQNIALGVRTGGADYFGSDLALTSAFSGHAQMFENNPDTASPWTVGEVNGAEIGIKSRA